MVLALSALYVRYGGLPWMQGAFYGIGAAVIAIIARSAYKLAQDARSRRTGCCGRSSPLSAVVTAWTESEIVWLFVAVRRRRAASRARVRARRRGASRSCLAVAARPGCHGAGAGARRSGTIAWYFAEAGAFVFGSGLAIVPFLHGGVVNEFHWLTERQFLDAVAVAMITPGPVVITVAFIGYLVAGPLGRAGRGLGVFLPCYLFVVIPAPLLPPLGRRPAGEGVRRRRDRGGGRRDRRRGVRARPARDRRRADGAHAPRDARRADARAKASPSRSLISPPGCSGIVVTTIASAGGT